MTDQATLVAKFDTLESLVNSELLERTKEIRTAILAILSRRHHFQIGPPGTAKSLLVSRIAKRIDGLGEDGYFHWLLTKYSEPAELFGPPSLAALKDNRFERSTEYKMPRAKIVFLDEIFKGNSSILNANLTMMNERLFFDSGRPQDIPLITMFAASNEEPAGEELNALWDRLHFRHEIKPLQDGGNFIAMLAHPIVPQPERIITWDDIEAAHALVDAVTLPMDIMDAFKMLRDSLQKAGIEPTERRWVDSIDIVRAEAFLNGRDVAEIDDLRPLRHVMWSALSHQREVDRCVLSLAAPLDKEAQELLEDVETLNEELRKIISDSDNPKAVAKAAVEVHGKLSRSKQKMDDLTQRYADSGRKSEILVELRKKFAHVAGVLMKDAFGIDEKELRS